MSVRQLCQRFDIRYRRHGVGYRFHIDGFGIFLDRFFKSFHGAAVFYFVKLHAKSRKQVIHMMHHTTVQLIGGQNPSAILGQCQQRKGDGCHTGTNCYCRFCMIQGSDAVLQYFDGRIAHPAVQIPRLLCRQTVIPLRRSDLIGSRFVDGYGYRVIMLFGIVSRFDL